MGLFMDSTGWIALDKHALVVQVKTQMVNNNRKRKLRFRSLRKAATTD